MLHRMRSRLVQQRTALIDRARAMRLECGVAVGRGRKTMAGKLPALLARDDLGLTQTRRDMLSQCVQG